MRYDDSLSFMVHSQTIQYNTNTVQFENDAVFLCFVYSITSTFRFRFHSCSLWRVSSSIIDPHPRVRTLGLALGTAPCEFMIANWGIADGANMSVETPHQPRTGPPTAKKHGQ